MAWVDVVAIVITSLLELYSIVVLVSSFAEKRENKNLKTFIIYCVIAGGIAFINYWGFSKFFLIIFYVAIILYSYKCYCFTPFESIGYTILSISLVGIMELISYIPINILVGKLLINREIILVSAIITSIVCYILRAKKLIMFTKTWLNKKAKKSYIVLFASSVIMSCSIIRFNYNAGMSFFEGLYLVIALGVMIYSLQKISLYHYELKIQKEYSEVYGNVVETIRQRQHKFMNQINAIYLMFTLYDNYDDLVRKQKEELDELKQYMMPNKILILEKPLIVAHVYQKMCEAKDNGIDLQINLSCSMREIEIPEIYLIEIIGNIFDNALEEVLARGLQETIYLSIFQDEGKIHIQICNEHDKISFADYSQFFTAGYSTKGKNRGIGLPYVKKIVKKYKGEIVIGNVQVKDKNCFSIKISFPI